MFKLIQNMRLSLKILISTGIVLTLGIATSDWLLYKKAEQQLTDSAWQAMHRSLKQQSERVTLYLDQTRNDAIFLSHAPSLQELISYLRNPDIPLNAQQVQKLNNKIAKQFSELIEEKGYLQIRLIDLQSGMEVIRVDRPKGTDLLPIKTTMDQLQNKQNTNYFRQGKQLNRDQVYISDINLNREHGKIIEPHQPTQRFVAGVFEDHTSFDTDLTISVGRMASYIRRFDVELTASASRAAQTGNLSWREHYNYIAPRLDIALEKSKSYLTGAPQDYIGIISQANEALISIEEHVFDLVAQGNTREAEQQLISERYLLNKRNYQQALDQLVSYLEQQEDISLESQEPQAIIVINTNFRDVMSSYRAIKTHETILVNQKGQHLYHTDESRQFDFEFLKSPETLATREPQVWANLSGNSKEEIREFDQHGDLHVSQRIYFDEAKDNRFIGLVLAKEKEDVLKPAVELSRNAFIIAMVTILFSLLFVQLIIRRQTAPITELTKTATRISESDLSENIRLTGKRDEVGKLAWAFSKLIKKLQEQNKASMTQAKEIQLLNEDLEQRIAERTASLKEATDRAESASTAKSEFLATMSHEIRTPMNGMLGTAQLLSKTELTDQQHKYLDTINHSGEALLTIINDILDFSKIESGKVELEPIDFNLKDLSVNAIELMSSRANDKQIDLRLNYPKDLAECFHGDPGRLRQIILNLVGNAIKFTSKGYVELSIEGEAMDASHQKITIRIKDTGIGIPSSGQSQLFEAFHQADASTTRKFGGTGLGLAICKRLTELMNGSIDFQSEEGKGTEFWITVVLPLGEHVSSKRDNENDNPSPSNTEEQLSGKILLAEDNHINQMVAKDLIEQLGIEVDIAENGIKAVDAWRKGSYDLILMDCLMPEMDGFEATRQIRSLQQEHHTPIIALTANVLPSDQKACADSGMDDFLGKPIVHQLLVEKLKHWLAQ